MLIDGPAFRVENSSDSAGIARVSAKLSQGIALLIALRSYPSKVAMRSALCSSSVFRSRCRLSADPSCIAADILNDRQSRITAGSSESLNA